MKTSGLGVELMVCRERAERMDAVLRFYGNPANYKQFGLDGATTPTIVELDGGTRAREALGEKVED